MRYQYNGQLKIEIEKENYEIILLNRLHARAQLGGVF